MISAAFKRSSLLPPSLPDDDFEFRKSFFAAILRPTIVSEELEAGSLFFFQKCQISDGTGLCLRSVSVH